MNDQQYLMDNYSYTSSYSYQVQRVYVPSIWDYQGTSEKLFNDTLSSDIAFAGICSTDTEYPYGCNQYHSAVAANYDTSVSPNVAGFAKYQAENTRIWYEAVTRTFTYFDQAAWDGFHHASAEEERVRRTKNQMWDAARALNNIFYKNMDFYRNQDRNQNGNNYNSDVIILPDGRLFTRPPNSFCSYTGEFEKPICVSKDSRFWQADLLAKVYRKRVENFKDWAHGCYVPNSPHAANSDLIDCAMFAGSIGADLTAKYPRSFAKPKVDPCLFANNDFNLFGGINVNAAGGDCLPSGSFTRTRVGKGGKTSTRTDISANNYQSAIAKARSLTGLIDDNIGEPVYLNNNPNTGKVIGRTAIINGKKVEIRFDPEGHPNQISDPNSVRPHVNYEITDANGNKIHGHIFVQ